MCQRLNCSHKGERMCSCVKPDSSSMADMKIHFLKNLSDMKLELSYHTLSAPAPYCLCVAGTCKSCGERLCMSVGMPAHLRNKGLLAVVLHHAIHMELKCPEQFVGLFHEEDRPAVQAWLEKPDGNSVLPEQEAPAMIYTIVQTAVDAGQGFFPDPVAWGSYSSVDQARKRLSELVAAKKETLSSRYDKEDVSDNSWEAYEDGYAASRFVRIEILTSELAPAPKEGPRNA